MTGPSKGQARGRCVPAVVLALAGLLPLDSGTAQENAGEERGAAAEEGKAPRTRLDVRVSPLVDLYLMVRRHAAPPGLFQAPGTVPDPLVPPPLPGFSEAVAAARALGKSLGHFLAWGIPDANLESCEDAAQLLERFSRLPDQTTVLGRRVQVRSHAMALARAIALLEPAFLDEVWPHHEKMLAEALAQIEKYWKPKEQECLGFVVRSFAMEDPGREIPIYLVVQSPPPGGATYRRRGGGGVSFVGIESAPGSQLFEVLLHESMHTLDLLTATQETVLRQLPGRLQAAGLPASDRRLRDAPHLLMFVQAAETVRRIVDPGYRHYGDVSGLYQKLDSVARVGRPLWTDYLDGKLALEQVLEQTVAQLAGR